MTQRISDSREVNRQAYNVTEFCLAHGIGRAHFYALLKKGLGPRVMRAGRRTLVSVAAAQSWREQLEAAEELKQQTLRDKQAEAPDQ